MKSTIDKPTTKASTARKSASQESRMIGLNPSWEDANALEQAALNARMTVSDLCRTIIEKEVAGKPSKSKILPVSGVPSGNRWPFKVDLQTWFKVRDEADRHGITIEQWAHAVIAKAIHPRGSSKAANKQSAAGNLETMLRDSVRELSSTDFDLVGYLKHPGDKFGITATEAQFNAWCRAYKASNFETLHEWAAATLDAASPLQITVQISKASADTLNGTNQTVLAGIGGVVSVFASRIHSAIRQGDSVADHSRSVARLGKAPACESADWSFDIDADAWEAVQSTAGQIGRTAEEVARAAISKRVSEIREFKRRERK